MNYCGPGVKVLMPFDIDSTCHTRCLSDTDRSSEILTKNGIVFANMSCFRAVMLPLGGSSETGFHQVIANSALHATLIRTSKEQETVDSIHHHAIAIKSVNRALLNAAESTSNTVIAAILQITWYDHFIGNTESWNMHMNGLRTIIDLRGGIEQLNQYRTLRLVTFWCVVSYPV